jgi:Ca2+-binding RTX toxin-like protein
MVRKEASKNRFAFKCYGKMLRGACGRMPALGGGSGGDGFGDGVRISMQFMQSLESRVLFAGLSVNEGVVKCIGTSGPDNFSLTPIPGGDNAIVFFGTQQEVVSLTDIKRVRLDLKGGNDIATINAGKFNVKVVVDCGKGNDEIGTATKGRCVMRGGSGNDSMTGGDADDDIEGESGKDVLHGGKGADLLVGGGGGDRMEGGAGKDTLDGNDGKFDSFAGGPGTDTALADEDIDYFADDAKDFKEQYSIEILS